MNKEEIQIIHECYSAMDIDAIVDMVQSWAADDYLASIEAQEKDFLVSENDIND